MLSIFHDPMPAQALRTITCALPFHLDDTDQVNALFLRWHKHGAAPDKRLIDLWAYGYIVRYFLIKFASSSHHVSLAIDQLVAGVFADVQDHYDRVRCPERFAAWVATICKHAFVNHLRARRSTVSIDAERLVLTVEDTPPQRPHDTAVIYQAVCSAIDALPPYLGEVARLRLLENQSYAAISEATGHAPATLRSYVNKALTQLRANPSLRTLVEELRD